MTFETKEVFWHNVKIGQQFCPIWLNSEQARFWYTKTGDASFSKPNGETGEVENPYRERVTVKDE